MLPAAVSTSMAFMLPVATPPNSLIYSYGSIKISDMVSVARNTDMRLSVKQTDMQRDSKVKQPERAFIYYLSLAQF